MSAKKLPPLDLLRQLLDCDVENGILYWRERPIEMFSDVNGRTALNCQRVWNARYAGKRAFTNKRNGYYLGKILFESYAAHRIIWKMATGEDPEFIDHINGDKSDNRITNLRSVGWRENGRNRPRPANNSSGVIGVHWCRTTNRWRAQIRGHEGVVMRQFADKGAAVAWRRQMEVERGYHDNHGRAATGIHRSGG